ncbi:unnamed protein product [Protopolystoma xenopodis]|uniref:Uncharacterized protein n=1 Tax=Protopolystoma xenopodis TaxID=117903 RepID=A0A3S5BD69_9PLAT|nr:unnamed protein product [Protopolystoma xenopodis]
MAGSNLRLCVSGANRFNWKCHQLVQVIQIAEWKSKQLSVVVLFLPQIDSDRGPLGRFQHDPSPTWTRTKRWRHFLGFPFNHLFPIALIPSHFSNSAGIPTFHKFLKLLDLLNPPPSSIMYAPERVFMILPLHWAST